MTLNAGILERPAPLSPAERDRRIALAQAWICMLTALTRIGLRCARLLHQEVVSREDDPKGPRTAFWFRGDPARAFGRVSRAVRLAMALALRIGDGIAALRAGRTWDPPPPARPPREAPPRETKTAFRDAASAIREELHEIGLKIAAEAGELPERPATIVKRLETDFCDDPAFFRLLDGPLKDAVAAICVALGLKPDWSLWTEDGFPIPAGGGVEDWIAFFAPEGDAVWTPRPGKRAPPPPRRQGPDAGTTTWRPPWPPPEPPDTAASRPFFQTPRPDHPPGRTFRASLLGTTIIAGAPGATERALARLGYAPTA